MKIRTFFYTIEQGILGIFKNKWFGFVTVATISACLFVFGIFYAIAFNVWNIVQNAEQNVSITVFFEEGITEERIDEIGDMIGRRPEVARYELVTAEEAWEKFSVQLGEYADGFTENPLENCANYQIYLGDVSKQSELVNYLEGVDGVRKINKSDFTADTLSGINMVLIYVFIGIILILFAVSIFLISNTVTMGISVRKEEITIMKYVGATDFFVRAPFVFEGMILGLIGAAIPMGLLYYLYGIVTNLITDKFAFLSFLTFLPAYEIFTYLIPFSLALGVGIGFVGSFFTVRKHLKV
ncbi:MAG: permease-like cell division protein FtsX [Lachnospiraceae bacterium]|nr:permease-like cell division protein FtsX [Lachnospiraceae bacterium]MBR4413174.1 permease-like cell division protein FtsX [Lachnospiraceae bacterium]